MDDEEYGPSHARLVGGMNGWSDDEIAEAESHFGGKGIDFEMEDAKRRLHESERKAFLLSADAAELDAKEAEYQLEQRRKRYFWREWFGSWIGG